MHQETSTDQALDPVMLLRIHWSLRLGLLSPFHCRGLKREAERGVERPDGSGAERDWMRMSRSRRRNVVAV